jgi:cell division protein ZapA|tara:strand:- start:342 stop:755 length:414 start_codon:yes stop_codon:yes gene_type:complete
MPEVTIKIGDRPFKVACPAGEENQLEAASAKLNVEAKVLIAHSGRVPESQMLLMSGLMLADRAIALEEKVKAAEVEMSSLRQSNKNITPEIKTVIKEVKVTAVPEELLESLAELSARAEAAADDLEQKIAQPGYLTD